MICERYRLINLLDMIIKLNGHEVAYAYGHLGNAEGIAQGVYYPTPVTENYAPLAAAIYPVTLCL